MMASWDDIVTIANNHTLDYGTDALVDTCTTLENAGVPYVEPVPTWTVQSSWRPSRCAAEPSVSWQPQGCIRYFLGGYWQKAGNGERIRSSYLKKIEAAGEYCDYLVVYMHWGIERDEKPQEYQRTLGRQLIDAELISSLEAISSCTAGD